MSLFKTIHVTNRLFCVLKLLQIEVPGKQYLMFILPLNKTLNYPPTSTKIIAL